MIFFYSVSRLAQIHTNEWNKRFFNTKTTRTIVVLQTTLTQTLSPFQVSPFVPAHN